MPLYSFVCTNSKCESFEKEFELELKLQELEDVVKEYGVGCPSCEERMELQLPVVVIHSSWSKWRQ